MRQEWDVSLENLDAVREPFAATVRHGLHIFTRLVVDNSFLLEQLTLPDPDQSVLYCRPYMQVEALIDEGHDEEAAELVQRARLEDGSMRRPGHYAKLMEDFAAVSRRRQPGPWQKDISPLYKEA